MSVLIWVQTVCKGLQQMTKSLLARKELNATKVIVKFCQYFNCRIPGVDNKVPVCGSKWTELSYRWAELSYKWAELSYKWV